MVRQAERLRAPPGVLPRSLAVESMILDERTCLLIRRFEQLQSGVGADAFVNQLACLSLQYSFCYIVILSDGDSLLASASTSSAAQLKHVLLKLAASLTNRFPIQTHISHCYDTRACADAVALALYRTGTCVYACMQCNAM